MCDDGKRPDGTTLLPWARGKPMVWVVTVSNTFAESHIDKTATKTGAAAHKVAQTKTDKYGRADQQPYLLPVRYRDVWHMARHGYQTHTGASLASQRIPGKQHICSSICPWLYKEGMQSPSKIPSLPLVFV